MIRKILLLTVVALSACARPPTGNYVQSVTSLPTPTPTAAAPSSSSTSSDKEAPPPGGWKANRIRVTKALQAAIEDGARSSLKDPDSAKFKDIIAFKTKTSSIAACGFVNAKNSYGGYVGYTPFRAIVADVKGKYTGLPAFMQDSKYPQVFYEVNPMCDPKNW